MFIHLLVPLYSRNVGIVVERKMAVDKWYCETFLPYCAERGWSCDLKPGWPADKTTLLALENKVAVADFPALLPETKYDPADLIPKGKWVLQALQSVLEQQAMRNYSDHDVVVMIDGSGKIQYDIACSIADHLDDGDRLVLGYRDDPRKTMDDKRVDIEKFENFLVGCKYKIKLRDAQCGCWGFQGAMLSKLPLIAQSYAIEIDILIAALSINMEPRFIPVTLIPVTTASGAKQTDYDPAEDMKKLLFLCYRLNIEREQIPFFLDKFLQNKENSLPESYITAAKTLPIPSKCPHMEPIIYAKIEPKSS